MKIARAGWMARGSMLLLVGLVGCGVAVGPRTRAAAPIAPLCARPAPDRIETTVHGQVLGHDGAPLRWAEVRVRTGAGANAEMVRVEPDGSFRLRTRGQGLAEIEVSGVGHRPTTFLAVLEGEPVDVRVRLGTRPHRVVPDAITVLYWEGDPAFETPRSVSLVPSTHGRFRGRIDTEAARVAYQLVGPEGPNHPVADPRANLFESDERGGFRSVAHPVAGVVEIEVDPQRLPPPDQPSAVQFARGNSPSARLAHALEPTWHHRRSLEDALAEAASPEATRRIVAHDDGWDARRQILVGLVGEPHDLVRHALLGAYFDLGLGLEAPSNDDRARADELLGATPERTPGWMLFPGALMHAAEISSDPAHRQRLAALRDAPAPEPFADADTGSAVEIAAVDDRAHGGPPLTREHLRASVALIE